MREQAFCEVSFGCKDATEFAAILMKRIFPPIGCVALLAVAFALSGCDQRAAEIAELKADNERLREDLTQLRNKANGVKEAETQSGKADLTLGINELWMQRFEGNEFRAKQRLSDKTIRITGLVDSISGNTVLLYGAGNSARSVRISVNLSSAYAAKIQEGLAELEKGLTVTMQGKFAYDRMSLDESVFVDKATGKTLLDPEIRLLGGDAADGAVPPPVPEK